MHPQILVISGDLTWQGRPAGYTERLLAAQNACHMVVTTRPGADEGRATLKGFEKARIEEQALHSSRPVVYVTWHNVQSYCEWASGKWGIACKLPTDEQWEFAARGPAGRIYPWGPEERRPDEHKANFGDSVGRPTPVGMFPDGDSPEGVADMEGNVLEWTRSRFNRNTRSLRGASFSDAAAHLRAARRLGYSSHLGGGNLGFRCVRE